MLEEEAYITEISDARAKVRTAYESYVARYGPIDRFSILKAGVHLTSEAQRLTKGYPFGPAVLALELFDNESQTAVAAANLDRRMVAPGSQLDGARRYRA